MCGSTGIQRLRCKIYDVVGIALLLDGYSAFSSTKFPVLCGLPCFLADIRHFRVQNLRCCVDCLATWQLFGIFSAEFTILSDCLPNSEKIIDIFAKFVR